IGSPTQGNKVQNNLNVGGGVDVQNTTAKVLFDNWCLIEGNTADTGGGMAVYAAPNVTFQNGMISGNSANFAGGGIDFEAAADALLLSNSVISGNSATSGRGGGIRLANLSTTG